MMAEKITIKKPISKFCLQTLHNVEENDYPINTIEASTWRIFVGAVQDCWEEAAQHFSDASLVVCLLDILSFPEGGVPVLATWWTYETHRGGENSHWFDRSCPSCSIFQQYKPSWQLRCSLLTWCPFRLAFGTAYSRSARVFSPLPLPLHHGRALFRITAYGPPVGCLMVLTLTLSLPLSLHCPNYLPPSLLNRHPGGADAGVSFLFFKHRLTGAKGW